jgi:hypothetical protein
MARPVIALALIAACSGAARNGQTGRSGEPGEPGKAGSTQGAAASPLARKVAVSWGIEQRGEMADVFLATTDETGKQVSHPLGRYKGVCAVITPAKEMNAVSGVACRTGPTGTELQAVVQNGQDIVVLQLGIDEGVKQDPMARQEIARVQVPPGAKIETGARPRDEDRRER